MHRNTYLLVLFLAILAALVVGVNIGKITTKQGTNTITTPTTPTIPQEVQQPRVTSSTHSYTDEACGIAFSYPSTLTLTQGASGSAVLVNQEHPEQSILLACQADIPRPPLSLDNIEDATVAGSLYAKIYHDTTGADGTPLDKLIFTNPKNGLDIFIAGLGTTFTQIISSIHLIP